MALSAWRDSEETVFRFGASRCGGRGRNVARCALSPVVALVVAMLVPLWSAAALAQTADDNGLQSFITPFPGGEAHRTLVVGDGLAEGLLAGLVEAMGNDPRVELDRKHRWLSGLTRPDRAEEIKELAQTLQRNKQNIIVALLGSQDRWSLRMPDGRRHSVGTREWREGYAGLVDEAMRVMKADGTAVYWVGLPIMRREEVNAAAVAINEVVRERAYLNGVKFIDVFSGFADEDGAYSAYGPDMAGKTRQLRERDGIAMTEAGYAKLAHFVETELKRDLAQAKNERAIPLAGSEAEQARIRPVAAKPTARGAGDLRAAGGVTSADQASSGAGGEQKADNGRISIKSVGRDGREEALMVEIVRPAIPAAVLALVTRRESPDKASPQGDSVVDQIPGGLTVMSSISPAGEATGAGRRKLSPAQTPYFRVLVKGERLTPRAGRADDTSWPKPEPEPEPKRAANAQGESDAESSSAAAPSTPGVATGSLPEQRSKPKRQQQR
ncbi:MAG: DUF459 domain-containing protein [Hyphomicrobiaceae bacterium]|nr:DUF459 domain-containing protein [Hyphomicrobiaceae bacterium]